MTLGGEFRGRRQSGVPLSETPIGSPLFGVEPLSADVPAYEAICRNCDWAQSLPRREMAEHAKRVHEEWYDHDVVLDVSD